MFDINNILRENIKNLTPYSSARDEFQGEASVYLDANENAFGSPLEQNYNRYPDPLQFEVKKRLSEIKGIVPALSDLPKGCTFAPRCGFATDECRAAYPPLVQHRPGHWIACWHAERLLGSAA